VITFFIALFIGQFISAAGAARYVPGGFSWAEAAMIGFGMMGRAELFFVVLEICYVSHKIMSKEIVCTFALTAMLMNISVPICIALYRPIYVKHHPDALADADGEHGDDSQVAHGHKKLEEQEGGNNVYVGSKCCKDERLKDLEEIKVALDGMIDEDASTDTGENTDRSDVDASPQQQTSRSKSRQSLLPQVCGCMAIEEGAVLRTGSYGPSEGRFTQ